MHNNEVVPAGWAEKFRTTSLLCTYKLCDYYSPIPNMSPFLFTPSLYVAILNLQDFSFTCIIIILAHICTLPADVHILFLGQWIDQRVIVYTRAIMVGCRRTASTFQIYVNHKLLVHFVYTSLAGGYTNTPILYFFWAGGLNSYSLKRAIMVRCSENNINFPDQLQ